MKLYSRLWATRYYSSGEEVWAEIPSGNWQFAGNCGCTLSWPISGAVSDT